jgi:hypothetical protein
MSLQPIQAIELLDKIQSDDKKFLKKMAKEYGAATFCCACGKNTAAGYYPFWHRYRRTICYNCSSGYIETLKQLGAWHF